MSPSSTQTELESLVLDEPKPKRQGPLEAKITRILQSQERMEANIARLTAAMPKTPIARWLWRLGL